jgi:hypothetical protein
MLGHLGRVPRETLRVVGYCHLNRIRADLGEQPVDGGGRARTGRSAEPRSSDAGRDDTDDTREAEGSPSAPGTSSPAPLDL